MVKRDQFWDCSEVDAIDELERRSGAVSGVGGLALQ
jgi:hypothetical protein